MHTYKQMYMHKTFSHYIVTYSISRHKHIHIWTHKYALTLTYIIGTYANL